MTDSTRWADRPDSGFPWAGSPSTSAAAHCCRPTEPYVRTRDLGEDDLGGRLVFWKQAEEQDRYDDAANWPNNPQRQALHASNLFSFGADGSAVNNETCLRMTLDGNRNDEEAFADIHG